jgi:sulfatase modifying factor 1
VQLTCPNCGCPLGDDEAGKVWRCRYCREIVRGVGQPPRPDNDNQEIADSREAAVSSSTQEVEATQSPDVGGGPRASQDDIQSFSVIASSGGEKDPAHLKEKPLTDRSMAEDQAAIAVGELPVECPKCGEGHNPGTLWCAKCSTCLRPIFLGVMTLIGPIFLTLLAIVSLVQVAERPIGLAAFCIDVVGIIMLLGLRAGRYWAWIGIQVLWGIVIGTSAIEAVVINPVLLTRAAVRALIIVLLWTYIQTDRVIVFCSVGRPRKGCGTDAAPESPGSTLGSEEQNWRPKEVRNRGRRVIGAILMAVGCLGFVAGLPMLLRGISMLSAPASSPDRFYHDLQDYVGTRELFGGLFACALSGLLLAVGIWLLRKGRRLTPLQAENSGPSARVVCPQCGNHVSDSGTGTTCMCQHCGEIVRVGDKPQERDDPACRIVDPRNESITSPDEEEVSTCGGGQSITPDVARDAGCPSPGEVLSHVDRPVASEATSSVPAGAGAQAVCSGRPGRWFRPAVLGTVILLVGAYTARLWVLASRLPDDLVKVAPASYALLTGLAQGSEQARQRQRQAVREPGLPLEVRTRTTGIVFRLIPAGSFRMGNLADDVQNKDGVTQQEVTLTKPFYCGKFEVTQAQWDQVMGGNEQRREHSEYSPVEEVSWEDCQAFVRKLCRIEGVAEGTYRLLTEAEWEYACRAGTETSFCWGDDLAVSIYPIRGQEFRVPLENYQLEYSESQSNSEVLIALQREFRYQSRTGAEFLIDFIGAELKLPRRDAALMVSLLAGLGKGGSLGLLPCGAFRPNAWGLHDMHGNVCEWCQDWAGDYTGGTVVDPLGPAVGENRVIRGGSYDSSVRSCGSDARYSEKPGSRYRPLGLRIARTVPFNP